MAIGYEAKRHPSGNTPVLSAHNSEGSRRQEHPTSATAASKSEARSQPLIDTSSVTQSQTRRASERSLSCEKNHRPRSLNDLPAAVLENICRFVPPHTLSALGKCNRFFNTFTYRIKVSQLLFMEKRIERNATSSSSPTSARTQEKQALFGCYTCFKILEPGRFPDPKHLRARLPTDLRRFCIVCGIRRQYHRPGEDIRTWTNQSVWVCRCLQLHSQYDYRCTDCQMHCPFGPQRNGPQLTGN